jgi:hypothetical protein
MATILNRQVTFATNGTVTAAGLHNLIDQTEIYAGIITTQDQIASVGSSDQLLIADADETSTSAPRRVTVGSMFNDALNNGIYTTGSFTNRVTAGSFVGNLTGNVTGTIVGTTGTIATLNSTTSTITNLSATTSTFLGTITGSTNVVNIGSGQIYKDASGNVGIGTTSPDSVLSVYANNKTTPAISARYSAAGFKAGLSVYNSLGFPYLSFNANPVSGSDNATYDINGVASKIDFATSSGSANIIFSNAASGTAGSTISWLERMRIDSSGNVGIGTASPATKLSVVASANSGINVTNGTMTGIFFNSSDTSIAIGSTSNHPVSLYANNSVAATILANGNFGVGTTSPNEALNINGTTNLKSAIRLQNQGTDVGFIATEAARIGSGSSNNLSISSFGTNSVVLATGTTERLRIDSSGNCSIGTATALSRLHVHGDLTMSNATVSTTAATGGFTLPATAAGYLTVSINGTSRKIPYYA